MVSLFNYRYWVGFGSIGLIFLCLIFIIFQSSTLILYPVAKAKMLGSDQQISLPYFAAKNSSESLVDFGYSMQLAQEPANLLKLDVGKASPLPANGLLFLQMVNGGDVYLNDVWIAGLPKSTATKRWLWYRPLLIPLPPNLINTDGKPNIIKVYQSTHEPYISISRPYVGSLFELSMVHEAAMFLSNTLANASNLLCLMVGLFVICTWLISPKDNIFGLAGGASILWSLLFTLALWTYMPISLHKLWRATIYLSTGWLVAFMTMFVLTFIGEPLRKFWILVLLGAASIAPIVYSLGGGSTEGFLDKYWTVPMISTYIYATVRLIFFSVRTKSTLSIILLIQSFFCIFLALHDYGVLTGILTSFYSADKQWTWTTLFFEQIYLSHLGFPFLILIMGYIFLGQYRSDVDSIKNSNLLLKKSLYEREAELNFIYEGHRKTERFDAARQERERIYQDIHDGIGSRLVTAIFSIRSGKMQSNTVEVQLLDCLSDLRFVINSENDDNNDIQSAIFEYCNNQEYLLAGDNLLLNCYIAEGPSIYLPLQIHLSIIRVLQEALTNVIKHANATEICVTFEAKTAEITLCISDNGQGVNFSTGHQRKSDFGISGGNGVTGMTARASTIGGSFSLDRVGLWTVARLRVPFVSPPLTTETAPTRLSHSVQT